MEHPDDMERLLEKHMQNQLTLPEKLELSELMKRCTDEELNNAMERIMLRHEWIDEDFFRRDWEPVIQDIVRQKRPVFKVSRIPETWLRYAAVLLIILGAGGIWLLSGTKEPAGCHIKLPGKGEKNIVRMEIGHGMMTLTVPRSWQYSLTLPDKSIVWLNAESSIRYAYPFNPDDRRIELTGEAFFEVAGDSSRPFYVKAGTTEIEAAGSRFNVSAYAGEEMVKASLVSGGMKLQSAGRSLLLRPGEEAIIPTGNAHTSTPEIIAAGYDRAAWKEGYFSFAREKVPAIMSELARWYDWNVTYSGNVPVATLSGTYCRETSEDKMLAILAGNGIKTKKTGRNISVIQ